MNCVFISFNFRLPPKAMRHRLLVMTTDPSRAKTQTTPTQHRQPPASVHDLAKPFIYPSIRLPSRTAESIACPSNPPKPPHPLTTRTGETKTMIEVILNDRLGKKIRVKCNEDDTIGDLKKLVAAQTGRDVV